MYLRALLLTELTLITLSDNGSIMLIRRIIDYRKCLSFVTMRRIDRFLYKRVM